MSQEDLIKQAVEQTLTAAMPIFENMLEKATEAAAKAGAATGAKSAIETIEHERRKVQRARYDRRLHNTKLLLRNYQMLTKHCEHAVYDLDTAEEEMSPGDIFELMNEFSYDDDLYVESIKKSAARTRIIMEHVNRMLGIYEVYCAGSKREDFKRHYRVIYGLYLAPAPTTANQLAKEENIDKRTVYKDIDAACEILTALIFGIDGMKK
nr:MAG TPA: Mga helix-turn-helix domain [Caudoviricetes sp.]